MLTLEAIVEALEFEVALSLDWDGQLSVAHAFGFGQDPPATLPFKEESVKNGTSQILDSGDVVLRAWAVLGLRDAIVAPLSDKNGALCGLLVGGRTVARGEFYDAVTAEQRPSFEVLTRQAEALFRNFALTVEIREQNSAVTGSHPLL